MKATMVRRWVLAVVIAVSGVASVHYANQERDEAAIAAVAASTGPTADQGGYRFARLTDPPRTVVTAASGAVVATLTDGSRTVVLVGPARTFRDAKATVTSTAWVRLAPQPWSAGAERAAWFGPWLAGTAGSTTPDVLAVALQYTDGAPPVRDGTGLRIAGDAAFAEGADFDRYLGIAWHFPDGVRHRADPGRAGSLDSAGFVRLVYGYREGYPLQGKDIAGTGLPRGAAAMAALGPGTPIVTDTGQRATGLTRLQPGDLLFFGPADRPGSPVSQVGLFLGLDGDGHRRVLASRRSADGPAFGGASCLDGTGKYAQGFRAAKRL
ncbi:hypothetical protein ACIOD2_42820 [Amycolatopsis sp. NPDC088138]|uniref:hypothetical protein n=1 Tax=Amycolatopsis sp. NPDC088138 TaxID=3363938 RepID=UPI0037F9FA01